MGTPKLVSLFAGCGGSSVGYRNAGFDEILAVDFDKNAIKTFNVNFPNVPIWDRDIRTIKGEEILKFCKLKVGELDMLDGSPPCQGFSTMGKRNICDERNDLFKHNIRLIDEIRPGVFLIENVFGMVKGRMKGLFLEYMSGLKSLDYSVRCKLMDSKYYGVPQSRKRLIWIGVRRDLKKEPVYPEPNRNVVTIRKALENVKPDKIRKPNKKIYKNTGFIVKTDPNKPAPTIITGFRLVHWDDNRFLDLNELKILCSFPRDFKFIGTDSTKIKMMGNAVMPKFMEVVAKEIKEKILCPDIPRK